MSVKPISLTTREREVANLVSKGLTRVEISAILNISDNTVKKHTTNIVRKCGATNQREAVVALLRNDYIYGEREINAKFYVIKRHTKITIDNDKETSLLTARSTQVCCDDNVFEKNGDVYCDGSIEFVIINGTKILPLREEKGRFWYQDIFSPPLGKGDVIDRVVNARLINSFKFPEDYFFIEQLIPCELLVVEVEVGDRFSFRKLEYEAKLGTNIYTPRSQSCEESDRRIKWSINFPTVLSNYTIRWVLKEVR